MNRYCTQCGWKLPDDAFFCGSCGHAVSRSEPKSQNDSNLNSGSRKTRDSFYDQLPFSLCANDVAMILGISRANAYTVMHAKDFPTIYIGKRMVVPKDKFFSWIEQQSSR